MTYDSKSPTSHTVRGGLRSLSVHHCEVEIVVALVGRGKGLRSCRSVMRDRRLWAVTVIDTRVAVDCELWAVRWVQLSASASWKCDGKLFSETSVPRNRQTKGFSPSRNVLGDVLVWFYVSRRIHSAKMSNGACTWCSHLSTMPLRTSFYVETFHLDHVYSVRRPTSKCVSVFCILALW
jgi:hypothetical protein